MFCLHLVDVDHYVALIQTKSPTNCDIYLVESIFKTHFSGRFKKDVKVLTVESCIRKYKYFHKANIVLCYNIIKMSEGRTTYFIILSDDKIRGIRRGKVTHYWEDLEQGIYILQLSKFDENAVTTNIFKNDAVYLTICLSDSDLTWDVYVKEKDPIIWDIDEGKAYLQIYISRGDRVEITGAPGVKEIESILEKLKEEGISV